MKPWGQPVAQVVETPQAPSVPTPAAVEETQPDPDTAQGQLGKLNSVEVIGDTPNSFHPDNQLGETQYQSPSHVRIPGNVADSVQLEQKPTLLYENGKNTQEVVGGDSEAAVADPPNETPTAPTVEAESKEASPLKPRDLDLEGVFQHPSDQEDEPETPVAPTMLTQAAANARLRRVCTPNSKGEYKVPQQVVDQFKDLAKRLDLMKIFEKVGHNPDRGETPLGSKK